MVVTVAVMMIWIIDQFAVWFVYLLFFGFLFGALGEDVLDEACAFVVDRLTVCGVVFE